MRTRVLAFVAALAVTVPLFTPPPLAAAPAADAAVALPSQSAIGTLMAPMNVTNWQMLPPKDGWDTGERFELSGGSGGGPPVPVHVDISAAELPTEEGAAGFLQVQLQNYRNATGTANLTGNLGPAPDDIQLDADEVYLGSFESQPDAAPRILTVVLVARYGSLVTAVDTGMIWDTPGPIGDDDRRGVGGITGALAALVDNQIP